MTKHSIVARPTSRTLPLASSAKVANASNPRKDRTATDTAASTAVMEKPSTPVKGLSHGRVAPWVARTQTPHASTSNRTATSSRTTPVITLEASCTPARFSAVVSTTATTTNTQMGTAGNKEFRAIPVNM